MIVQVSNITIPLLESSSGNVPSDEIVAQMWSKVKWSSRGTTIRLLYLGTCEAS